MASGIPKSEFSADTTDDEDAVHLRSRTDERKERKEAEESLMRLARALVDLPMKTLERLALPEGLLDVVMKARRVPDGGPKNRALRLVRIVLRDDDAASIERALREVHEPPRPGAAPPRAAPPSAVDEWREKLIAGGEPALTELVDAHPEADRRQLRQLVRNVTKASDDARAAAAKTLDKALRKLAW